MENEWPPLQTCPQYKTNMIRNFVDGKYPWEGEGNEVEWFKLYKRPSKVGVERMLKELQIANKFLHQMRTTRGYGLTCRFPLWNWSFAPLPESKWDDFEALKEAMEETLTHISLKTGKAYELVKIESVVNAPENLRLLLTIVAKKRNSVPETFYSMVSWMTGYEGVMECILKPDGEADWGANENKLSYK